jgi:hypothetical protein
MKEIPESYKESEILSTAYRMGWNHGHGIACHNVPRLGKNVFSENLGRVTATEDNIRELHEDQCFAAADHGRDFSPFEFQAKYLNDLGEGDEDSPSSEEAWEAFEEGTRDAIFADLSEYDDEDYGIETQNP